MFNIFTNKSKAIFPSFLHHICIIFSNTALGHILDGVKKHANR